MFFEEIFFGKKILRKPIWAVGLAQIINRLSERLGDTSYNFYFTANNGIKTRWNSGIALNPDLRVCSTSTGLTTDTADSADCAPGKALTNNAVAIIYSLGKNFATGGSGGDEAHNPNPQTSTAADRAFVFHEPTQSGATNGEFDDVVVWLSPNILYNRLVMAGKLP